MKHITADVVIMGVGIGGYQVYKQLKKRTPHAKIVLVDTHTYYSFIPMLHEVATGSVSPSHMAVPIRELIARTKHEFVHARVTYVDPQKKIAYTTAGTIQYTYAVMAMGSKTNYYNVPGAETYTHHIRTLPASLKLHDTIMHALENKKTTTLTISIVGGGYTGVELAGQLADISCRDIPRLYPEKQLQIHLFNQTEILSNMSQKIQDIARKRLGKKHVIIHTDVSVTEVTEHEVRTNKGNYQSDITVWTAGFKNFAQDIVEEKMCTKGQIHINENLHHPDFDTLYAIGDIACLHDKKNMPLPQLAQVAHQQGIYLGKELAKRLKHKTAPHKKFHYASHGTLMPIGDWFGIGVFRNIVIKGRIVWFVRRTAYLLYLPGILRKLRTVSDWTLQTFGSRQVLHIEPEDKKGSVIEVSTQK